MSLINRLRIALLLLSCAVMWACGNGAGDDPDDLPPELRLSIQPGTLAVRQGQSVSVRVDMPSVADSDLPSGYAIDLDEVAGRIDVTTEPCPAGAGSRMCQDWTITPRAGSVPGQYDVNIRSVGSRAGTASGSFRLVVVADPPPMHGAAVAVAHKAGHLLVLNDAGRVFALGQNTSGEVRAAYQRLSFPTSDRYGLLEPRVVDEFVEVKLPAGRWVGVAVSASSSFAIRDDGTAWAWGFNRDDELGLMSIGNGEGFVDEPRQIPGLAGVRALSTDYDGSAKLIPIALLADGRVRRWHERSGLFPYCEVVQDGACVQELTGVVAIAGAAQDAVFLKGDGSVWRAPHRPCDAGDCPPDRDLFTRGVGRVERLTGALPPAVAVARVIASGIALAADGSVWQWDRRGAPNSATPVAGLADVIAIAGSYLQHPYALKRDGTVWVWNPSGADPPQQVVGLANVVAIVEDHAITGDCGSIGGAVWQIEGKSAHRLNGFGSDPSCVAQPTRMVTVTIEGDGRVVSSPAGIDCPGACSAAFPAGSLVILNESPARGWTTALRQPTAEEEEQQLYGNQPDWRGDRGCAHMLTARTDLNCSLRFIPGGDRRLVVSVTGDGTVTSSPAGIDCGDDCAQAFAVDALVRIITAPGLGYRFGDFVGDGDCADGRLTMDAVKNCIARFTALPAPAAPTGLAATPQAFQVQLRWDAVNGPVIHYTLERERSGTGVFMQVADLEGTDADFIDGTVAPQTTYQYRLIAHNVSGASQPAFVSVTTLTPAPSSLTVTVQGNGSVSSDPPGITCGADCSQTYPYGTVVRLIAELAPDHSAGFVGDADCADGIVTITRPIACIVTFVPRPGSGWQQLGAALTATSGAGAAFSLAIDDDRFGEPVVAYVEAATPADPARLYVKRRNGAGWETLGNGALNPTSVTAASDPSVAARFGTPIHVAWSQGNGVQQNVFVARFNGAAWESVGPPGIPLNYVAGSRAVRPSLAFDTEGLPQVAWIEDDAVKWKRFDGANWVASIFGPEGPTSSNADRVRLATSPSIPVIAWTEGAVNDRRLKVAAGQSFAPFAPQVNAPYDVPVTITHFGLRPDGSGALAFWTQDERPFSVFARRWQGGPWEDYGAPPVPVDSNLLLSFAVARRSVDVAFSLQPLGTQAFVAVLQRSGGDWYRFPALETPGGTLGNLELEAPRNDSPIVAGTFSSTDRNELRVYRYFP